MVDFIAIFIAVLALGLSGLTAWLTLLRPGTVKMTQPTVIFFGPDMPVGSDVPHSSKVYLRTLLFSTSKRGCIIESMYVSLRRNETSQHFNIWVYGEGELKRGSGLHVGETGVTFDHHFLPPTDANEFRFVEGTYVLKLYCKMLGANSAQCLFSQELVVTSEIARELGNPQAGIYFDWGSDSGRYEPHIDVRPSLA